MYLIGEIWIVGILQSSELLQSILDFIENLLRTVPV